MEGNDPGIGIVQKGSRHVLGIQDTQQIGIDGEVIEHAGEGLFIEPFSSDVNCRTGSSVQMGYGRNLDNAPVFQVTGIKKGARGQNGIPQRIYGAVR